MKRFLSLILAFTLVLSGCFGAALAAGGADPRASLTITSYMVAAKAGSTSREILIGYDVKATNVADSLGVSSIEIYKSDGTKVTTITGTTSNGLIRSDSSIKKGTYTYTGTSGVSYYAKVTVFATIGSNSDSRVVTTDVVKAP